MDAWQWMEYIYAKWHMAQSLLETSRFLQRLRQVNLFSRYQPESYFIDYKQKSSGKKLVHIIFQTNQLDLLKVVTTMECSTLVSLTKNVREFINM